MKKHYTILIFVLTVTTITFSQTAPDFTVTDINGETHQLYADYLDQGKTVVLDFFFTDCGPCNQIAPLLEPLYQKWGGGQADVEFLSITGDPNGSDDNAKVAAYENTHGLSSIAVSNEGNGPPTVNLYENSNLGSFTGYPTFVVVAPDGLVEWDPWAGPDQTTIDLIDVAIEATGATGLTSTCTDGIQNGNETGVDCGGLDCPPCPNTVTLDICVLQEGTYNTNDGTMSNTLQNMGVLPITQPYSVSPWNYQGTETLTFGTGITDWVLVSFRTSIEKSSEVTRTAGVLETDGCINFPNELNVLPIGFNTPIYIVVEHRNHIGVMSPQAISVSNDILAYDFRVAQSYSTPGADGQIQMEDGAWCMFAGDIDPSDANSYDINGQDKAIWQTQNGNFDAYFPADLNQDSDVNGADKGIWQRNNGIFSSVPK